MQELLDILAGRVSTEPADLVCYGYDASGLEARPSAIVWPQTTEDVAAVMRYASAHGVAVIPRGAGTGMTGGAVPASGAIVLSLERMNRILEIDADNLTVLVEPGVINGRLQRELERHRLFYPPDPASLHFCTIGGNVAENAGGPRALKYGVTRDYVIGLEAVLPDGTVITTGVRTAKGVVGYDLTRLLVGSEGTLAIVTKIRLKVVPLPEDVVSLLVLFRALEPAGIAVREIIAAGIIPRAIEFMDREAVKAIENYRPVGLPKDAEAVLLVELDGHAAAITKEAGQIKTICEKLGGSVIMAENEIARMKLWESRRALSPALFHISPAKINEDIVVPRNRLAEMLVTLRMLSEQSGIRIVNFGHAGDGNIHVNLMVNREDQEEYARAKGLVKEIFSHTLRMGGTISGEHGIGLTKAEYLPMEVGEAEMHLMKRLKAAFDPKNILNPGKIFR